MAHVSIWLERGLLIEEIGKDQVVKDVCAALLRRLDFIPKSQENNFFKKYFYLRETPCLDSPPQHLTPAF